VSVVALVTWRCHCRRMVVVVCVSGRGGDDGSGGGGDVATWRRDDVCWPSLACGGLC
jgi:hypothetical protein